MDYSSDVDLLVCLSEPSDRYDSSKYSIYNYERIQALWEEGNPFSWHLHLESKPIYSSDGTNFISGLGEPSEYENAAKDCRKFMLLFKESYHELIYSSNSAVFHLSCMFLASRNFATCHSLKIGKPIFSRLAPLLLEYKLPLAQEDFDLFVRARILSTRGYGNRLSNKEIIRAISVAPAIIDWMEYLLPEGESA